MTQEKAEVKPEKVETQEPAEVKAPQEELPIVDKEIEQLRSRLQQLEENWKSAQRVTSKKDQEIQELRTQLTDREADRDILKAVIAELAERKGVTEEDAETDVKRRKPDLLSQFTAIEQRQALKRAKEKGLAYKKTVEEDLGLKPSDEEYRIIQSLVTTNQFDMADRRIETLKAKKQPTEAPKEEPKETEEERITRLAEEKVRKILDEKGYTKQEKGLPSASSEKMPESAQGKMKAGWEEKHKTK